MDEELRKAFQNLVQEELPDRFKTLLEQLRNGEVPPAVTDVEGDGGSEGEA